MNDWDALQHIPMFSKVYQEESNIDHGCKLFYNHGGNSVRLHFGTAMIKLNANKSLLMCFSIKKILLIT